MRNNTQGNITKKLEIPKEKKTFEEIISTRENTNGNK